MAKYVWPCPNYSRVSSPYGYRKNPISKKQELHRGVDLACPKGKPILATKEGTVQEATYHSSYGNYVLLDHGGGLKSRYAHASQLLVKKGDPVKAGQTIAKVGSTGNSTGAHLDFEIIVSGSTVDPLKYVSDKDTKSSYVSGQAPEKKGKPNGTNQGDNNKEISNVIIKDAWGSGMTARSYSLLEHGAFLESGCELSILNDQYYVPLLKDEVVWETERKNTPGKLTFTVVKDEELNFQEGNPVRFRANNKDVFYGYVFEKKRSDRNFISVTCYDQLRYLKNKDTILYEDKTYSALLKQIAKDYNLKCGMVEDTEFVIKRRLEEASLFDILGNASDITLLSTGKLFVLYDDFGALSLKDVEHMVVDLLIDPDVTCEYDYSSSIDQDTYNKVALAYDNKETGNREITIAQDEQNQNKWGILQYYEKIDDNVTSPLETAKVMLKYYNHKTRSLKLSKILGDVQVRAGSSITVNMELGDINVTNKMLVEKAKHTFSHGEHFMDLQVSGIKWGGFVG